MSKRQEWRYIADEQVSASFGLAADEYMTTRSDGAPLLRLYTYKSHCALIGRFQHLDSEIRQDYCKANNIEINRRPTGGGAILMGADQLGLAITVPREQNKKRNLGVRELFHHYARGVVDALTGVGISGSFHRKNDIEVDGRKIAGMGFYFDRKGGLLFHTSLLVDLDVELMLNTLRTPWEKISDKHIKTVSKRVTTLRKETGTSISIPEVRQLIKRAYQTAFDIKFLDSGFSEAEREGINALEETRYKSPDWIDNRSFPAETFGQSKVKTDGGLLEVHLTLTGDSIKAAYITGDFFADDATVSAIERGLKSTHISTKSIAEAVDAMYTQEGRSLPGVPAEALMSAVVAATTSARETRDAVPGGCFA